MFDWQLACVGIVAFSGAALGWGARSALAENLQRNAATHTNRVDRWLGTPSGSRMFFAALIVLLAVAGFGFIAAAFVSG